MPGRRRPHARGELQHLVRLRRIERPPERVDLQALQLLEWLETGHGLGDRVLGTARPVPMNKFRDCCNGGTPGGAPYEFGQGQWRGRRPRRDDRPRLGLNGADVRRWRLSWISATCGDMAARTGSNAADGTLLQSNLSSVLGTGEITPVEPRGRTPAVAVQGCCWPADHARLGDRSGRHRARCAAGGPQAGPRPSRREYVAYALWA